MSLDLDVKQAIYGTVAREGRMPHRREVAERTGATAEEVLEAYGRLAEAKLLVLEADGVTIRMAPPFSGVPTQHLAEAGGQRYFANCAWDALGVLAALGRPGTVHSRCERTRHPLALAVGPEGPEPCDWLFHCPLPATLWWEDIVFT